MNRLVYGEIRRFYGLDGEITVISRFSAVNRAGECFSPRRSPRIGEKNEKPRINADARRSVGAFISAFTGVHRRSPAFICGSYFPAPANLRDLGGESEARGSSSVPRNGRREST